MATLDASTGTWSWSGEGAEGGTSFGISGTAVLTGDPEDINGVYIDDNDMQFKATATVTIDNTETEKKSSGTGKATKADGTVIKEGKVTDAENAQLKTWQIFFLDTPPDHAPGGIKSQLDFGFENQIDPTTFQGDFTQTVLPEPSTWVMLLIGVGAVGVATRRSRRKGAVRMGLRTAPIAAQ